MRVCSSSVLQYLPNFPHRDHRRLSLFLSFLLSSLLQSGDLTIRILTGDNDGGGGDGDAKGSWAGRKRRSSAVEGEEKELHCASVRPSPVARCV